MKTALVQGAKKGFQFLALVALSAIAASYLASRPASTPAPFPKAEAAESAQDLDVQYFRAELALAKKQLENALDKNSREPNFYSPVAIAEMRMGGVALDGLLKDLETSGRIVLHKAFIQGAKTGLELAKLRLQSGLELRKLEPGSVDDLDMEQLQLAVKAAELAVAKVEDPSFMNSEKEQLYWCMFQLGRNIVNLRISLAKYVSPMGFW